MPLEVCDQVRFLELIFDCHLIWLSHICILKTWCQKALNISQHSTGCIPWQVLGGSKLLRGLSPMYVDTSVDLEQGQVGFACILEAVFFLPVYLHIILCAGHNLWRLLTPALICHNRLFLICSDSLSCIPSLVILTPGTRYLASSR